MITMKVKTDPTGKFKDVPMVRIIDALGIVPRFVHFAAEQLVPEEATPRAVMDKMASVYQFYLGDMEGGTVDAEGVYSYPEDPDMYPLVRFRLNDNINVYQYQYAIVAVTDGTDTIITRMD